MIQSASRSLSFVSRFLPAISTRKLSFRIGPSPVPLPTEEQKEFERLQKLSSGSFSVQNNSTVISVSNARYNSSSILITNQEDGAIARTEAKGDASELHPDIRKGSTPEFEGEKNPKTGEIGGPKTEPLRWGSTGERGDWSYNGRVTDF